MPATEIVTTLVGNWGGKEILQPTWGVQGNVFPNVGDWLVQKMKAHIVVIDVTNTIVVMGANQWVAFEEDHPGGVIRTVLVIT